jgi:hypothetical protein
MDPGGADALEDAIAVGTVFNIITRYADALEFAIPSTKEFDRPPACCSSGAMRDRAVVTTCFTS